MKIISKIAGSHFLIRVSKKELAHLMGHYGETEVKSGFIDQAVTSETEIAISDIYMKHHLLHNIQSEVPCQKARQKLQDMLDALTEVEDQVEKLSRALE